MTSSKESSFLLSEDISYGPDPLYEPISEAPNVIVIGGGVTGLTTAWLLLDHGYYVTILSKEWVSYGSAERLTSQIAGALWELPPAGCGPQAVQEKLQLCQKWALESYQIYRIMAGNNELSRAFGLSIKMCTSFHLNKIQDDTVKIGKMKLVIDSNLEEFHWGMEIAKKYDVNINSSGGLRDAYEHLAPIIDTDVAMAFLMGLVQSKGARLETGTIHGDLLGQEECLLKRYHADAIINATGLMACETAADDSVYPLRGAVLRVINDGSDFSQIKNAMLVSTESSSDGNFKDMAFIVPRNDNILVLGSISQPNEWSLDLTPDSPEVQNMRRRCEELVPVLKNARLDPTYPLAQGKRPYRTTNVRVEREERKVRSGCPSRIVHSYGHGGAGWSLAFGSGRECVRLVNEILQSSGREYNFHARL